MWSDKNFWQEIIDRRFLLKHTKLWNLKGGGNQRPTQLAALPPGLTFHFRFHKSQLRLLTPIGWLPVCHSGLSLQMLLSGMELEFSMEGLEESFVKVKLWNANIWTDETSARFYFILISKRCKLWREQKRNILRDTWRWFTAVHCVDSRLGKF